MSSRLALLVLLALIIASAAGLYLTRPPRSAAPSQRETPSEESALRVDQQPLDTAHELASLAQGDQEQRFAADALRLADHQLDLAFTGALRTASNQPARETPAIRAIQDRIDRAQGDISAGNDRITGLKAAAAKAAGDRQANLEQQIEVVQAEVSLHQDELADAQQDLIRAGGDERSKIQELLDQHEAAEHTNQPAITQRGASNAPTPSAENIVAQASVCSALRSKEQQIADAQQEALTLAAELSKQHVALDRQVDSEKSSRQAAGSRSETYAAPVAAGSAVPAGSQSASPGTAAANLKSLRKLSDDEKSLAEFDRRIQDLQELAATYGRWNQSVESQARQALHRLIKGGLWILLAILTAFVIQRLGDHSLERLKLQRTQQATLRAVIHFVVQTLTVLAIVLLIFGTPSQFSTILGLAGAGLTIALKDFIVGFLGWFVLMGRNGIRVGDWVEINGVFGEVVEIGILRTVLLETGNWTEAGLPTGRQVAFLNGYAVEGHYFNFTTSGQWLWDELEVAISGGADPYPLIERIRTIVEKETERDAQAAQQDWQHVSSRYGVKALHLGAALDLRPHGEGVLVKVRYMTRAVDRSEVRTRLNHAIVELLHARVEQVPSAEVLPATGS
jgi:small-conductance mechanosensitive channel